MYQRSDVNVGKLLQRLPKAVKEEAIGGVQTVVRARFFGAARSARGTRLFGTCGFS
jgi:hypothetical protein